MVCLFQFVFQSDVRLLSRAGRSSPVKRPSSAAAGGVTAAGAVARGTDTLGAVGLPSGPVAVRLQAANSNTAANPSANRMPRFGARIIPSLSRHLVGPRHGPLEGGVHQRQDQTKDQVAHHLADHHQRPADHLGRAGVHPHHDRHHDGGDDAVHGPKDQSPASCGAAQPQAPQQGVDEGKVGFQVLEIAPSPSPSGRFKAVISYGCRRDGRLRRCNAPI